MWRRWPIDPVVISSNARSRSERCCESFIPSLRGQVRLGQQTSCPAIERRNRPVVEPHKRRPRRTRTSVIADCKPRTHWSGVRSCWQSRWSTVAAKPLPSEPSDSRGPQEADPKPSPGLLALTRPSEPRALTPRKLAVVIAQLWRHEMGWRMPARRNHNRHHPLLTDLSMSSSVRCAARILMARQHSGSRAAPRERASHRLQLPLNRWKQTASFGF